MKIRFPLSAKILLWFFLNLIFLGLVFYVFVRAQYRLGLDSLLMGRAGDRIQAVADVISYELNESPRAEWNDVLKRRSNSYQVQFVLFENNGTQLAGETVVLPSEVLAKLRENHGPPRDQLPPPGQLMPPLAGGPEPPPGSAPDFGPGAPDHPDRPPEGAFVVPALAGSAGTPDHQDRPPEGRPFAGPHRDAPPRFMLHTTDPGRYWVGMRVRITDRDHPGPLPATLLAVSNSIRGSGLFFDFMPWVMVGFGGVLVSVLFWLPLVRGITHSLSQITHATAQIAEGRFDARVTTRRQDELGQLSQAINQMASRLSGFVSGQKRFLGDIAHELCSPIARIQLALGILEQRADEKQKAYVEDLREEVQQMSSLVNELLSFSKASLEPSAVKLQPVPLRAVVEQAVRRENTSGADVRVEVAGELSVLAEPELLLRSLANLVRNAIRYAGAAGPIIVSAHQENVAVVISVADNGPGVPEDSLAQIFDPFYRTELSRTRETGGVGLGLAIVKTCIESCQGTVRCSNRAPTGLEVFLTLQSAAGTQSPSPA